MSLLEQYLKVQGKTSADISTGGGSLVDLYNKNKQYISQNPIPLKTKISDSKPEEKKSFFQKIKSKLKIGKKKDKQPSKETPKRSRIIDFITGVGSGGVMLPDPEREDIYARDIFVGISNLVSSTIDFTTGIFETVESKIPQPPGKIKSSKISRAVSNKIKLLSEELAPENPDFSDQLFQGVGSMGAFIGLSYVTGGSAIVPVVMESIGESGSIYETNRKKGSDIEESGQKAAVAFGLNLILNTLLNVFDIAKEGVGIVTKAFKGVTFEGAQEGAQQVISNASTGEPLMNGVLEAMGVGAVLGGGTSVILPTGGKDGNTIYEERKEEIEFKPSKKVRKEVERLVDEIVARDRETGRIKSVKVKGVEEVNEVKKQQKEVKPEVVVGKGDKVSTKRAKLPSNLTFAKPRFGFGAKGLFSIDFESDVDKALFIVAQEKRSASDEKYMDFLRESLTGLDDGEIRSFGRQVKASIKDRIANDIGITDNVVSFPADAVRVSIKREVEVKKPHQGAEVKTPVRKSVIVRKPKVKEITEKQIKTTKNIKDAKATLKKIQVELSQAVIEAEALAEIATEKRSGVNVEDINKLKRIYATTKAFQEGDIETIRASKHGDLVNRVVENVQEVHPQMDEAEAFEFALDLPTKAEEAVRTPTIRELEKKEKKLSKFLDLLRERQKELKIKEDNELSREWTQALAVQEKLEKIVRVPQRQLPVGEGKKRVSRLGARLKGVTGQATQEDIEALGLSTYNQSIQNVQLQKAAEYVESNPDDAIKVAMRQIDPPKGLLANSVFIALTEAGKTDTDLALKVTEVSSTRLGQEINILKKILADNPVVMMQDVVRARIEGYERKTGKKISTRIKSESRVIDQKIKPTTRQQWDSFIESIRC